MNKSGHLQAALASTRALFGAVSCSCALTSDDGASLTFVAADGAGAARIVGVSIPVNKGIVGWVALSGQPTAVADVAGDQRFARDVAESTEYVPTSILAVPMIDADGEVMGVVEVLDPDRSHESRLGGRSGTAVELGVLAVLASQVAATITLSSDLAATRRGVDPGLAELVSALSPEQLPMVHDIITALVRHGR